MSFDISYKNYYTWRYRNTILLGLSLLVFFILADTPFVHETIRRIGELGYVGAFITGMFFVSTFTVAPAILVLFHLAGLLNPWEVAILAGLGAVLGDYIIFRLLRDRVFDELKPLFRNIQIPFVAKLFYTPYFSWLLPLLGAAIIASPLPDEAGIGLLGISKLKSWQFLLLSFCLNSLGIFIVITLARSS